MSETPQDTRPLRITFADVPDAGLVITAFTGTEALSRPFEYQLSLTVPVAAPITFSQILGKPAVLTIQQAGDENARFIHGLISRVAQGKRDDRFITYTADLVPALWLLTRVKRSRIFQTMTTEEIIRKVIGGLYDLSADSFKLEGKYHPRNYTTQYRETDFDFLSRVIEEEGIYYFFTHTVDETKIVFSDNPRGHLPMPGRSPIKFREGLPDSPDPQIVRWTKAQQLRTTSFELTDHTFEMPTNRLEAINFTPESVKAGTVTQELTWPNSDTSENTDHPGGYVRWRDGIAPGGAERADDLQHVFDDNARLSLVRSQEELAEAVQISGQSTFGPLTAGHKFTLAEHPDADGEYVVTAVEHTAKCGEPSSGEVVFEYSNTFECIPIDLPFRPAQITPQPFIHGTQTGLVVGSDDAEIEPDKYGRVKVWFRWDPAGPRALDTSCWVRVAQFWAGRQWGAQFIPRIGDEVIVAFEDGSPDRPIIIGSVYNADNMPIYTLPDNKTQSGIKTHSSKGGGDQNYNEFKFEDKKGHELVSIHAEKDMSTSVENNQTLSVGHNQSNTIGTDPKGDPRKDGTCTTTIFGDTKLTVQKGDYFVTVEEGKSIVSSKNEVTVTSQTKFVHITAETEIKLSVGSSTLLMKKDGTIDMTGVKVTITGSEFVTVKPTLVNIEGSDKVHVIGGGATTDWEGNKIAAVGSTKIHLSGGGATTDWEGNKIAAVGSSGVDITGTGGVKITGSTIKLNS